MGTLLFILQIIAALTFIVLMAVQTDKNEQSGVMGLGAQGGRMSGSIDMAVGAERILKPMSRWAGIGFLVASLLAAANGEIAQRTQNASALPWFVLLGTIVAYVAVMMFSDRIWQGFTRLFGANS